MSPAYSVMAASNVGEAVAPLIDGALFPPAHQAAVDVINPSNGRRLFSIPMGCTADVDRAVASARAAFADGRWDEAPPSFRRDVLHRFAGLIASEAESLDRLDAEEMGKPVSVAAFNALRASGRMRFFSEAVDKVMGDVYSSDKTSFVAQRRVPRGVVGAITPWNFPVFNVVLKIAPALAAGNCIVVKPSEHSTRSALRLARLALDAGLPPGVFNVVPGLGETTGRALALHMGVDMVAFTGSTDVGKAVMQYAGQSNLKCVMAECGGKSPQIVFDDGVDLDSAADFIARLITTNQGQLCSAGSRLLVQRSIAAVMTEKVAARMKQVEMGDPSDPATTFGPLVSARQLDRVMRYIDSGRRDGSRLVLGGRRALTETGGFFVEPTLFCDVAATACIAQEEIFGPVLAVTPFEDEDEAVSLANGTIYALAAYVWTARLSTAMRMARRIRSTVLVNAAPPTGEGAGHAASSEPAGLSGMGTGSGLAGMESYMRRQLMAFNHG